MKLRFITYAALPLTSSADHDPRRAAACSARGRRCSALWLRVYSAALRLHPRTQCRRSCLTPTLRLSVQSPGPAAHPRTCETTKHQSSCLLRVWPFSSALTISKMLRPNHATQGKRTGLRLQNIRHLAAEPSLGAESPRSPSGDLVFMDRDPFDCGTLACKSNIALVLSYLEVHGLMFEGEPCAGSVIP